MIIWGGARLTALNTGGLYDPVANSWEPTSTGADVPSARTGHTAVWTGTEVITWGGGGTDELNDGGHYNPETNNWYPTATVGAPSARAGHTAVWTGSEMIIWGGSYNDGTDHYLANGAVYRCVPD
jgi:N-acetylneuraminic acid mutarotase